MSNTNNDLEKRILDRIEAASSDITELTELEMKPLQLRIERLRYERRILKHILGGGEENDDG